MAGQTLTDMEITSEMEPTTLTTTPTVAPVSFYIISNIKFDLKFEIIFYF